MSRSGPKIQFTNTDHEEWHVQSTDEGLRVSRLCDHFGADGSTRREELSAVTVPHELADVFLCALQNVQRAGDAERKHVEVSK